MLFSLDNPRDPHRVFAESLGGALGKVFFVLRSAVPAEKHGMHVKKPQYQHV